MNKQERQAIIRELIATRPIGSQEELRQLLAELQGLERRERGGSFGVAECAPLEADVVQLRRFRRPEIRDLRRRQQLDLLRLHLPREPFRFAVVHLFEARVREQRKIGQQQERDENAHRSMKV